MWLCCCRKHQKTEFQVFLIEQILQETSQEQVCGHLYEDIYCGFVHMSGLATLSQTSHRWLHKRSIHHSPTTHRPGCPSGKAKPSKTPCHGKQDKGGLQTRLRRESGDISGDFLKSDVCFVLGSLLISPQSGSLCFQESRQSCSAQCE